MNATSVLAQMREDVRVWTFVRPRIDAPVIRDADGQVITYGNRWGGQSPPEEAYSVDAHPERFAPVHTVAEAIIEYLTDTYDVQVLEGEEASADLLRPRPDAVRAVRIQPNDPACAALTFVFTAYPGIVMHAGLLHDFYYPDCGCDACDSNWDFEADDLQRTVLAIVNGRYREGIELASARSTLMTVAGSFIQGRTWPSAPWILYWLDGEPGERSARSLAGAAEAERIESARTILQSLSNGWAAWPFAAQRP